MVRPRLMKRGMATMAIEIDPLRRLVHITLRRPPPPGFWQTRLTPGERYQAAATYFVLGYFPVKQKKQMRAELNLDQRFYKRPNLVSVDQFVNRNLRRILGQLNRRTELRHPGKDTCPCEVIGECPFRGTKRGSKKFEKRELRC